MQTFGFNVVLHKSRKHVTIDAVVDEKVVGGHDYEAAELDELIELLGAARAGLLDAVSAMLDPMARVRTIEKPTLLVQAVPPTTDELLVVRDPAYGWIGFRLTRKLATELARLLAPK